MKCLLAILFLVASISSHLLPPLEIRPSYSENPELFVVNKLGNVVPSYHCIPDNAICTNVFGDTVDDNGNTNEDLRVAYGCHFLQSLSVKTFSRGCDSTPTAVENI